jgi:glycosyltransferase involved in cell wall biosynthesis
MDEKTKIMENETISKRSLSEDERETIISWCDDDNDKVWIYSSQQPMIRKLLNNPLFECVSKEIYKYYRCYPNPVSIEGYLPLFALSIRKKRRVMSEEQRNALMQRGNFFKKTPERKVSDGENEKTIGFDTNV